MASLIESLIQSHGADIAEQISNRLGIPKEQAAGLLPAVAPMILGGLKREAEVNGGAERVDHILNRHGDESVLEDVGGFLSQKAAEPAEAADPNLGGLLGQSGTQASQMIGSQLGISQDKANQIIPMLAPIVLGYLNRQRNQAGGGAEGQNLLTSLLDRDGDGSILDDVAGMLGIGGTLGSLLGADGDSKKDAGSEAGASDMLGKVLGGFFGGQK